jgi:hypothetical protein
MAGPPGFAAMDASSRRGGSLAFFEAGTGSPRPVRRRLHRRRSGHRRWVLESMVVSPAAVRSYTAYQSRLDSTRRGSRSPNASRASPRARSARNPGRRKKEREEGTPHTRSPALVQRSAARRRRRGVRGGWGVVPGGGQERTFCRHVVVPSYRGPSALGNGIGRDGGVASLSQGELRECETGGGAQGSFDTPPTGVGSGSG